MVDASNSGTPEPSSAEQCLIGRRGQADASAASADNSTPMWAGISEGYTPAWTSTASAPSKPPLIRRVIMTD